MNDAELTELARREMEEARFSSEATLAEVAAEIQVDAIVETMTEPAGPLKRRIPGRSPSGPVETGVGPINDHA